MVSIIEIDNSTKSPKKLSDLKGKIKFSDNYDYKSLRTKPTPPKVSFRCFG